jgi:hypothetical protein
LPTKPHIHGPAFLPASIYLWRHLLYLVLHGLISLVDVGDDGFIAYALEIGTAHRYLYGNWLTEQEIPVRPQGGQPLIAELTGVDSGEETLNTNFNVVVQVDKAPDVDHDDVRAVFKLPRPSKIHHFVAGTLANALQGTLKPIAGKPVALSGIRIFEYTFQDSGDVHLTQASGTEPLWMCPGAVRAKGQTLKVAVLHIYDQPGEDMLDHTQHTLDEFKKSAAFLGTDITLSNAVIAGPQTSSLPGLLPAETTSRTINPPNLRRFWRRKEFHDGRAGSI